MRRPGADPPHGDPGDGELVDGAQRRRQRRKIDLAKLALRHRRGARSAAGAAPRDGAHERRSSGRHAFRGSRLPRRAPWWDQARSREASAISASTTTHRARATASRGPKARAGPPHQRFRAVEIAELGHRDAAKRERRRVVAQRHPVQRGEWIARGKRPCRCGDQRIHDLGYAIRNPVTLVTPAIGPSATLI